MMMGVECSKEVDTPSTDGSELNGLLVANSAAATGVDGGNLP